ncbi:AAA family ATPase [Aerococcus viridans]|uniref:AAA family ATPase n=1 Tax=Aerococcus viridans TaxID=1377 RepID=UPI002DBE5FB4|nr:AAA family ATPase [Aerococcus viridans]MEC1387089.1 AAA family ATPase [Aerococcus viridans]
MITELNLPNNIFNDSKLTDIKQKNFIFGRNGTGKSSITKAIVDQYGAEYDIRVFQGFQRIVENNGELNAIALGSENAEIQPKIDSILEQISDLNTDIIEPANDVKNTFSLKVEMNKQYDEQARKVEKFYIHAASDIKDKHTDWTGHTYNKNHLKKILI